MYTYNVYTYIYVYILYMYVYTLYILYLRVLACNGGLNRLLRPLAGEAAGTIGGPSFLHGVLNGVSWHAACVYIMYVYISLYVYIIYI